MANPIFFAGADMYGGDVFAAQKDWNGAPNVIGLLNVAARHGTWMFEPSSGNPYYVIPGALGTLTSLYLGLAFYPGASTGTICQFHDTAGDLQIHVDYNTTAQTLTVYRGAGTANQIGQLTSSPLQNNVFAYIEVYVLIDPSAGAVTVRLNEATVITATGVNTRASALTNVGGVKMIANYFDDFYLADGFLGDVSVIETVPNGAGAVTGFTPLTGSNYQNVDEAAPNGDTDYNYSGSMGAVDTFTFPALATSGDVLGVRAPFYARVDSGSRQVRPVCRISGTNYYGTAESLNTTYTWRGSQAIWILNPATAAAWTEAQLNAAEFGYEVTD